MRGISAAAALLFSASSLVSSVGAIAKVTRSGKYLVTDGGERFYIKGVAYQEQGRFLACCQLLGRSYFCRGCGRE